MAEQRRSAKEIMAERRQRMEAMHPGYLLLNRKMMRLVYIALILRFFVFIIQRIVMGGGNMAAIIPLAAGTLFNILVGYALYYCMLHFSWKIAPVYLVINLFFGLRSAANLAGLVPTLPTPTLVLLLCTYVQIIFEYGLLLAISLKKDVHEMQRLNRIVESGRPLGDEEKEETPETPGESQASLEGGEAIASSEAIKGQTTSGGREQAPGLSGSEALGKGSAEQGRKLHGFAEARALLSSMKEEEAVQQETEDNRSEE